jgi:D-tyrosyl-tRNA(Tyr) deacylase
MKAVLQRVSEACVSVDGQEVARIGAGLVVLLGIAREDTHKELAFLVDKIVQLRVFEDEDGKMNRSLLESRGDMLVVSQFTLLADCKKGRRPSFFDAMAPADAAPLVDRFVAAVASRGIRVKQGVFGAMMAVSLVNEGPVTITLDTDALRKNLC